MLQRFLFLWVNPVMIMKLRHRCYSVRPLGDRPTGSCRSEPFFVRSSIMPMAHWCFVTREYVSSTRRIEISPNHFFQSLLQAPISTSLIQLWTSICCFVTGSDGAPSRPHAWLTIMLSYRCRASVTVTPSRLRNSVCGKKFPHTTHRTHFLAIPRSAAERSTAGEVARMLVPRRSWLVWPLGTLGGLRIEWRTDGAWGTGVPSCGVGFSSEASRPLGDGETTTP